MKRASDRIRPPAGQSETRPVSSILVLLWAVLLMGLAPKSPAAEVSATAEPFFQQTFGDFSEELAMAREEGKRAVMIYFDQEDCPFCLRMEQTVLNRPEVRRWYRERFACFRVDIEAHTEVTDFQGRSMTAKVFAEKQQRVRATPVIAFYDLAGKRIVRYTGPTRDAQEFLWLGEFVADGHYQRTNFTRYKRDRQSGSGGNSSS